MFAFEYAISGTWTDPKVEKLQSATQSLSAPLELGFPNR
jgi:uncharacterized protein YhdP